MNSKLHCSAAVRAARLARGDYRILQRCRQEAPRCLFPSVMSPSRQDFSAVCPGLLRRSHSWLKAEDGESEMHISLGTLPYCLAMYICFLNNLVFAGFDSSLQDHHVSVQRRNWSCRLLLQMNLFCCVPTEPPELKA